MRVGVKLYSCVSRCCMYAGECDEGGCIIYSFESDYESLCRHNLHNVNMCIGATDANLRPLFTVGLMGVANKSVVETCDLRRVGYQYLAKRLEESADVDAVLQELNVCSHIGHVTCLRSVFCSRTADCTACRQLAEDRSVLTKAERKGKLVQSLHVTAEKGEDYGALLSRTNPQYFNATEMIAKVQSSAMTARRKYKKAYHLQQQNTVLTCKTGALKRSIDDLKTKIMTGTDDWPEFLNLLKSAHDEGTSDIKLAQFITNNNLCCFYRSSYRQESTNKLT